MQDEPFLYELGYWATAAKISFKAKFLERWEENPFVWIIELEHIDG